MENINELATIKTNIQLNDINTSEEFKVLDDIMAEYKNDLLDFSQGKTLYQIEKFTALEEGASPVHQYKFVLIQLRYAIFEGRRMHLDIEKKKRKIQRISEILDEIQEINESDGVLDIKNIKTKAELYGIGLDEICDLDILTAQEQNQMYLDILSYKGKMEEIRDYVRVLKELQHKYGKENLTVKKFEEYEPLYWEERLSRQAYYDHLSKQLGINAGNIWAIKKASQPAILEDSNCQSKIDLNDLEEIIRLATGDKIKKKIEEDLKLLENERKLLD